MEEKAGYRRIGAAEEELPRESHKPQNKGWSRVGRLIFLCYNRLNLINNKSLEFPNWGDSPNLNIYETFQEGTTESNKFFLKS